MNAITIGVDLAKSVFQVHGVDAVGAVVIQKGAPWQILTFFAGLPTCLWHGSLACPFWAREIAALGHEVKLMPPSL